MTSSAPDTRTRDLGRLTLVGVGLVGVVSLMLLAMGTPAVHSSRHDLPLAVSGPAPAVAQVEGALQQKSPGSFDVTAQATADDVVAAVRDRDAVGGIALGSDGTTVYTASGPGTPYATILGELASAMKAQGQQVTVTDLAPLTEDDPAAAGMTAVGLPLIFAGMISAVVLSTLLRRRSPAWRVAGSITFAVLAGLVLTAIVQGVFGTFHDAYWSTAGALALGIAAISLTALGLESLFGYPGLGLAALLMLFVANPPSGLATGPQWLPAPWGDIGQLLPVGAAGTAVRSAASFDGGGSGQAYVVLAVWAVIGISLAGLSYLKNGPAAAPADQPDDQPDGARAEVPAQA